jgi:RNA polymerase sigma-70 factor, ECF subfamily
MSAIARSDVLTSQAEPTDEALLERAAMGDQAAIAALYDRYKGMMFGLATRITGDAALAQDVVQEAFVGIWRNAARFSSARASARTWILSICHHRAVDAVRRRRLADPLPDPELPPPPQLALPDVWGDVSARLDATAVRGALAALPEAQREVIDLAYFGGLTQTEIAERTGAPLGTVKSRVRLGLIAMADQLREPESGPPAPEGST